MNANIMNFASENDYGLVYVLTNSAMPGMVKIGMTQRADLEQRMKELYGTGVPVPFECAYACKVRAEKTKMLEQALHEAFEPYRVNPKREFFEIKPEQAIAIMRFCDEGDVTNEVKEEIKSELTQEEQNSTNKLKPKRPQLNYDLLGIPRGAVLTYTKDASIHVTIENEKKVRYNNEVCSLTAATRKIMGLAPDAAIQPTPYWNYGAKNLMSIYNTVFPVED
ncbi:MAG: GIY-YIG nuclease family protein [Akkermansia sp.]|nr:GIY-YIG nuclease family protein [Akkermansia sp.]